MRRFMQAFVVVVAGSCAACSSGGASKSPASGVAGTGVTGGAGSGTVTGAAGQATGAAGTTGGAGSGTATGAAGTTGAAGGGQVTGAAGTGVAGTTGAAGSGTVTGAAGTGAAGTPGNPDGSADATTGADARVFTTIAKMMVMGSSNELGTCWRAYLWQELHMNGITNFDFVGQQHGGPSCTVVGWNDTELQAQSGNIITDITSATYLSWFQANPPDVILMHFGGADLLSNLPIDGVMKSYQRALDAARMVKPNVILLIAQHTPEGKDTVPTLNADIAAWAPTVSTAASPVIAVDLYTGMVAADFSDGVHLNQQGAIKVADRWYQVLKAFFKP